MKYELDLYDKWCEGKEEGRKEGLSEGLRKGREEGMNESVREIVCAAFRQGYSAEAIASLTRLSVGEIEKLRETAKP